MLQFPCLPVYQKEFCFIYTQKNTKNNTRHPKNHEGYVKPLVVSVKPLVASVKPLVASVQSLEMMNPFFEHLRAAAMLTSTQHIFLLCRQILEPSDHISWLKSTMYYFYDFYVWKKNIKYIGR